MSDAFAEDSEFPSPLPLPKGERIKVRGIWLFDDLVIFWGAGAKNCSLIPAH